MLAAETAARPEGQGPRRASARGADFFRERRQPARAATRKSAQVLAFPKNSVNFDWGAPRRAESAFAMAEVQGIMLRANGRSQPFGAAGLLVRRFCFGSNLNMLEDTASYSVITKDSRK